MPIRYSPVLRVIACILSITLILCVCGKQKAAATADSETTAPAVQYAQKAIVTLPEQTAVIEPETTAPVSRSYDKITVATYPYLPDLELCEELLTEYWAKIVPEVELEFVWWDAYTGQDLTGIDILMYDCMFTTSLVENGYLQPLEMSDIDNKNGKRIIPVALESAIHNETLYGIPVFMCSYFPIHNSDDVQMAEVENFADLYRLISERKLEDPSTGLTTDFAFNIPCFYLDALLDFSGEYSTFDVIPDTSTPDVAVVEFLTQTKSILAEPADIAEELVTWNTNAAAFNLGFGCAHYGYSENMCEMYDQLDNITIRSVSFSEGENIPLFFTDIASISSEVTDPQKIADCKTILNILSSKEYLVELCRGREKPQYILPARQSAYAELAKEFPMYGNLHKLAVNDTNRPFRIGTDILTYLDNAEKDLRF